MPQVTHMLLNRCWVKIHSEQPAVAAPKVISQRGTVAPKTNQKHVDSILPIGQTIALAVRNLSFKN